MSNFKKVKDPNVLVGVDTYGDAIEIRLDHGKTLLIEASDSDGVARSALDRDRVDELISILSHWRDHGTLEGCDGE